MVEQTISHYHITEKLVAGGMGDVLIPAGGRLTLLIKRGDEFMYGVVNISDRVSSGKGPL